MNMPRHIRMKPSQVAIVEVATFKVGAIEVATMEAAVLEAAAGDSSLTIISVTARRVRLWHARIEVREFQRECG